ncbi:MAG TPA: PaaI family thioesterase [Baekduia sp.]|jgi:uncharacterized protein (TIGR00369 family)
MEQTRTYTWTDPRQQNEAGRAMAGLEFLRLLRAGGLGRAPMMETLDFTLVAADEGHVEFACTAGEFLYNPIGVVAGGVAATLLDAAAGCAIHTTLPAGIGYTTVDLSVHYLRPITTDLGTIRAIGTVLNRGRRTALGQAEVRDGAGRLLAHATSSCMLFPIDG